MTTTQFGLIVDDSVVGTEGETSGTTRTYENAKRNMDDQLDEGQGIQISLHAMWRACGSPPEYSPASWLKLSGSFIEGYLSYLRKLQVAIGDTQKPIGPLVHAITPEDRDEERRSWNSSSTFHTPDRIFDLGKFDEPVHFLIGDSITTPFIAEQYCYFLGGCRDSIDSLIHGG